MGDTANYKKKKQDDFAVFFIFNCMYCGMVRRRKK
jgi:hypothetical protein